MRRWGGVAHWPPLREEAEEAEAARGGYSGVGLQKAAALIREQ